MAESLVYAFSVPRFNRPFDARSMELVIFDLDGTLIDSRLDLIDSVNAMLRLELPELPDDVVASYVGDGAPMLVRRALAIPRMKNSLKQGWNIFSITIASTIGFTHVYPELRKH